MISKYLIFIHEELLQLLFIPLAPNVLVVLLAVTIPLVTHVDLRAIKCRLAYTTRCSSIAWRFKFTIPVVPASGHKKNILF